jgi:glycosyltransferase involved in cell wall biosynthesis
LASGVAPARISVIPSAIDLATVQRATDPAPPSAAFIVAAGALTPEKGHATLIEAFARITADRPEMRLRILGEGPERRELTERAARLGIGARVDLQGEVEDLSASIAGAALFVQPSYREALGTAVLEAMARGIPVLASGTGGLTELLGGGAGRLVPPHDALALATNIEALLDHPATRADLARLARARVAEYDAPGMADRVVQVYRSALGDT